MYLTRICTRVNNSNIIKIFTRIAQSSRVGVAFSETVVTSRTRETIVNRLTQRVVAIVTARTWKLQRVLRSVWTVVAHRAREILQKDASLIEVQNS